MPYWTDGDAAAAALEKAYYLALMVEPETGLEAYDPQLEATVAELRNGGEKIGVKVFDQVAKLFGRRTATMTPYLTLTSSGSDAPTEGPTRRPETRESQREP